MERVDNILDPSHYATSRLLAMEAETLPPWCYTSQEFYELEVERIFRRVWNFVGRADQIPNPGDYFTLEFVGVPIIVVRDRSGGIRAFVNFCRHRGTLLLEGEGHCQAFKCPYHSWVYSLEGELLSASEMQRTIGFDPAQYGLMPVRLEAWDGFLFVNLSADGQSLAEYLGDLPEHLACYRMAEMVSVRRREYEIACNWKLWVENAKESLHIATVHRKSIHKYASASEAGYEVLPARGEYVITAAKHGGSMALLKGDPGFPAIETLLGRAAEGTLAPLIYPCTYLGCTIDTVWYLQLLPAGPMKTKLIHGACFPRSRTERPDFAEIVQSYYSRWDITTDEDIVACELQQRGVRSAIGARGRFSYRELLVHQIDNWVLDRVLGR